MTAGELRFTRADGRGYREPTALTDEALAHVHVGRAPAAADSGSVDRDVHAVLRQLGFREAEARTAMAKAQAHVGTDASLEVFLREALRCTRPERHA